jgi:hypothetical protein
MSDKQNQSEDANLLKKSNVSEQSHSLLKKRLIWQHLTQKKIKKVLKARFRKDSADD